MAKMNMQEEQKEVYNLIIIIMVVIAILSCVYLFSRAFISKDLFKKKDDTKTKETIKEPEFDYSKIIVGELLNRDYSEYYVLAFDSSEIIENKKQNMKNFWYLALFAVIAVACGQSQEQKAEFLIKESFI